MMGFSRFCKDLLSELYVSIVSPRTEKVFTMSSSSFLKPYVARLFSINWKSLLSSLYRLSSRSLLLGRGSLSNIDGVAQLRDDSRRDENSLMF
jgi:hypothetical protein